MSVTWHRVWWWNGGAHTVVVPDSTVDEVVDRLKGDGFYCWVTPGFPIEASIDPPPGS